MSDATQAMPPTEPPGSGDGSDDFDDGDRRKIWMIVAGVLVLGLLVGALIAVLASGGDDSKDQAADGSTTSSSSTTTTSTPALSTTQATNAPTSAPTQPPVTGPQITSLNTQVTKQQCLPSDSPSTTVSWSTTNANQTTLSVDGPGIYGTYGPSGSVTVGAGCPPPGQGQSHTYTVTAKGPGGQVQKSATVQFFGIPQS